MSVFKNKRKGQIMKIQIEINPKYNEQGVPKCTLTKCGECRKMEGREINKCKRTDNYITTETTCDPAVTALSMQKKEEEKGKTVAFVRDMTIWESFKTMIKRSLLRENKEA